MILLCDLSTTHEMSSLEQRWQGSPGFALCLHLTYNRRRRQTLGKGCDSTAERTLELRQLTQATFRLMRSSCAGDGQWAVGLADDCMLVDYRLSIIDSRSTTP